MKIQELLPHLNKGWVAMDIEKRWWYSAKKIKPYYGVWITSSAGQCLSLCLNDLFDLDPFDGDWKDSLMKCGEKK